MEGDELDQLRRIALALPGVIERISHGEAPDPTRHQALGMTLWRAIRSPLDAAGEVHLRTSRPPAPTARHHRRAHEAP
jgi:hypothetical protein